jgi:Leucine-rich repeat (LRR) protein
VAPGEPIKGKKRLAFGVFQNRASPQRSRLKRSKKSKKDKDAGSGADSEGEGKRKGSFMDNKDTITKDVKKGKKGKAKKDKKGKGKKGDKDDDSSLALSKRDAAQTSFAELIAWTLGEKDITRLSAFWSGLGGLTSLDLSSCSLAFIPFEVFQLKKLARLQMASNSITVIPPEIENVGNSLLELDLSKNYIMEIPPEIGFLRKLNKLNLRENEITVLPPQVALLVNLARDKPESGPGPSVATSARPDNRSARPGGASTPTPDRRESLVGSTSSGKDGASRTPSFALDVEDIKYPPQEVMQKGQAHFLAYLKEQAFEGREAMHHFKLMLVGSQNVGKSSLLRTLSTATDNNVTEVSTSVAATPEGKSELHGSSTFSSATSNTLNLSGASTWNTAVSSARSATTTDTTDASTESSPMSSPRGSVTFCTDELLPTNDGIASIEEWSLDNITLNGQKQSVQLSVWDFTGQESYWPLYQMFFDERAIYLVVFSAAEADPTVHLQQWLDMIAARCGKAASIVLVGTKCDDPSITQMKMDKLRSDLTARFAAKYAIKGVVFVSNTTNTGLSDLKAVIDDELSKDRRVAAQNEVPKSFLLLREMIIRERYYRTLPLMTWKEWRAFALLAGIDTDEQLSAATTFLSEFGYVLQLQQPSAAAAAANDDDSLGGRPLARLVVLHPQWLANFMASLQLVKAKYASASGLLSPANLRALLKLPHIWQVPPALLLTLYHHLDLALVRYSKGSVTDGAEVILPALLPDRPAEPHFSFLPLIGRADDPDKREGKKKLKKKKGSRSESKDDLAYGRFYFVQHLIDGFFARVMARVATYPVKILSYSRNALLFDFVRLPPRRAQLLFTCPLWQRDLTRVARCSRACVYIRTRSGCYWSISSPRASLRRACGRWAKAKL